MMNRTQKIPNREAPTVKVHHLLSSDVGRLRRRKSGPYVVFVGLGVAMLAACTSAASGGTASGGSGSSAGTGAQATAAAGASSPAAEGGATEGAQAMENSAFSQFFWSDDEAGDDDAKFDEGMGVCMADRGFEYDPLFGGQGGDAVTETPEVKQSMDAGYGIVAALVAPAEEESMPTYPQDMSDEEAFNLQTAQGECLDEVQGVLSEGDPRFNPLYEQLLDAYYSALNSDAEMLERQQVWRQCVQDRTGIENGGAVGMEITRSNIQYAAEADIAARLGRTVRLVDEEEANAVDDSQYEPPVDLTLDGQTKMGFLIYGPYRTDGQALTDAANREVEIRTAADECDQSSGINDRILQLQDEAMQRVAEIDAGNTDAGASDPATSDPAAAETSG